MWVLIITLMLSAPSLETPVPHRGFIALYQTEKECQSERTRIDQAMHEAYPGDNTFMLKCEYMANAQPRKQT